MVLWLLNHNNGDCECIPPGPAPAEGLLLRPEYPQTDGRTDRGGPPLRRHGLGHGPRDDASRGIRSHRVDLRLRTAASKGDPRGETPRETLPRQGPPDGLARSRVDWRQCLDGPADSHPGESRVGGNRSRNPLDVRARTQHDPPVLRVGPRRSDGRTGHRDRRQLDRLFRIRRLPARVLSGVPGGRPTRDETRRGGRHHRSPDAPPSDDEGRHRARRGGPRGSLGTHVVVLPRSPWERTWSCYHGRAKACGVCDSCALRLRGFREAGVTDPVPYETRSRPKTNA